MAYVMLSPATRRLYHDYMFLKDYPVPYVEAEANTNNIFEWCYLLKGPEHSPYDGGYYLGRLLFSQEFPFKAPSVYMDTPNGRFCTNIPLCLPIGNHSIGTWKPQWRVSTLLIGLFTFMLDDVPIMDKEDIIAQKRRLLAAKSLESIVLDDDFRDLFPRLTMTIQREIDRRNFTNLPITVSCQSENNIISNNCHDMFLFIYILLVIVCLLIFYKINL